MTTHKSTHNPYTTHHNPQSTKPHTTHNHTHLVLDRGKVQQMQVWQAVDEKEAVVARAGDRVVQQAEARQLGQRGKGLQLALWRW